MTGREQKKQNNLFFLCSLIEYIARKTKNRRSYIVDQLGMKELKHIYELADVYHCENIDKISDDLILQHNIARGTYDNISKTEKGISIPSYWDIGKVMHRLVLSISGNKNLLKNLFIIYNSWLIDKIDNYNSSMYYENCQYQTACYKAGRVL